MTTGENENRQISRDSLFVLADLRIDGFEGEYRVRVRNISTGGLMAESPVKVVNGQLVWVNLRNIGWVEGSVAWVQDNRFGLAFREEIDPSQTRSSSEPGESTPRFVRSVLSSDPGNGVLRKI